MAQLQKATQGKNAKNNIFEDDIGDDFLSSWKLSGKKNDAPTTNTGNQTKGKAAFSLDKFDMDFDFDGGFGTFTSFDVDMDLDFKSPSSKRQKPSSAAENKVEGKKSQDDSFKFEFDFKEMDGFDLDCDFKNKDEKHNLDKAKQGRLSTRDEDVTSKSKINELSENSRNSPKKSEDEAATKAQNALLPKIKLSNINADMAESQISDTLEHLENASGKNPPNQETQITLDLQQEETVKVKETKAVSNSLGHISLANVSLSRSASLNSVSNETLMRNDVIQSNNTISGQNCASDKEGYPEKADKEIQEFGSDSPSRNLIPLKRHSSVISLDKGGSLHPAFADSVSAAVTTDPVDNNKSVSSPVKNPGEKVIESFSSSTDKKIAGEEHTTIASECMAESSRSQKKELNGSEISQFENNINFNTSLPQLQRNKQQRSIQTSPKKIDAKESNGNKTTRQQSAAITEASSSIPEVKALQDSAGLANKNDISCSYSEESHDYSKKGLLEVPKTMGLRAKSTMDKLQGTSNVISIDRNKATPLPQKNSIKHSSLLLSRPIGNAEKSQGNLEKVSERVLYPSKTTLNSSTSCASNKVQQSLHLQTTLSPISHKRKTTEAPMPEPVCFYSPKTEPFCSTATENTMGHSSAPKSMPRKSPAAYSSLVKNVEVHAPVLENTKKIRVEQQASEQKQQFLLARNLDSDKNQLNLCSPSYSGNAIENMVLDDENSIVQEAGKFSRDLDQVRDSLQKAHEEAKDLLVRAIVNNSILLMLNQPLQQDKMSF